MQEQRRNVVQWCRYHLLESSFVGMEGLYALSALMEVSALFGLCKTILYDVRTVRTAYSIVYYYYFSAPLPLCFAHKAHQGESCI